jgi:hypothetical protein
MIEFGYFGPDLRLGTAVCLGFPLKDDPCWASRGQYVSGIERFGF